MARRHRSEACTEYSFIGCSRKPPASERRLTQAGRLRKQRPGVLRMGNGNGRTRRIGARCWCLPGGRPAECHRHGGATVGKGLGIEPVAVIPMPPSSWKTNSATTGFGRSATPPELPSKFLLSSDCRATGRHERRNGLQRVSHCSADVLGERSGLAWSHSGEIGLCGRPGGAPVPC